jgi:uncharacterized protein YwgA
MKKYLILKSLNMVDKIDGRKKIQKIIYLINNRMFNAFSDYRFYLYGPYSDQLFYELQNLNDDEIINEISNTQSYSYKITNKGKEFLDLLEAKMSVEDIEKFEMVKKLNDYSSEDLEIMSSLYYISREFNEISYEEMVEELMERKPHLGEERIKEDLEIFNIMNTFT